MKKILFPLLIALMGLGLSSCGNENYIYENQEVLHISLTADSWTRCQSEDVPLYYAATFDVPELTRKVYGSGLVSCEIVFSDARQALPYITHYQNAAKEMWTRTVDFQYAVGKVTVFVTTSDHLDEVPEVMDFRLSLVYQD